MSKEKLILALDVAEQQAAREIIDELGNSVGAYKIGLQLFTGGGPSLVRELVTNGHRVFLDLKFHDIPNTVAAAAVEAARMGVWMFNVHSLGGGEMMAKTVEAVGEVCSKENLSPPLIIGVTILTSTDQITLREIGLERKIGEEVLNLAKLTAEYGLDGVVASPLESEMIRDEIADRKFIIVTPGIRPISATNDDQKRVTSPADAIASGSDYLVIGRPILEASDRKAAVEQILREMAEAG